MPEQESNKEQYLSDLEKMTPEAIVEKYGAAALVEMLKRGQESEKKLETMEEENRATREENESLKKENFRLRFDELTSLEMRRSYYMRANHAIENMITEGPIGDIVDKDEVDEEDMAKMADLELTVASADLAFLSKYNNDPDIQVATGGEHTGGDIILKETAGLIQDVDWDARTISPRLNTKTRGYRLGGDEFGLLMEMKPEEAEKVAAEFKIKQNQIEVPGADLAPMINIDIAHVSEGVEAFVESFPKDEREEMSADEKAKKIQDLMTRIADRRAMLQKGRERLHLLVDLLDQDESKFDKNFTWMKKGAFGLEKGVYVDLLKQKEEDPDGFDEKINEMVRNELKLQRERAVKRDAKEYEAVIKIADKKYQQ